MFRPKKCFLNLRQPIAFTLKTMYVHFSDRQIVFHQKEECFPSNAGGLVSFLGRLKFFFGKIDGFFSEKNLKFFKIVN